MQMDHIPLTNAYGSLHFHLTYKLISFTSILKFESLTEPETTLQKE